MLFTLGFLIPAAGFPSSREWILSSKQRAWGLLWFFRVSRSLLALVSLHTGGPRTVFWVARFGKLKQNTQLNVNFWWTVRFQCSRFQVVQYALFILRFKFTWVSCILSESQVAALHWPHSSWDVHKGVGSVHNFYLWKQHFRNGDFDLHFPLSLSRLGFFFAVCG